MIRKVFSMAILYLAPTVALPASFSTSIQILAVTACSTSTFGPAQPPDIVGSESVSSGPCYIYGPLPESESATATVNPWNPLQISGSASSVNGQNNGAASAAATYLDTVMLKPPSGYTGGGVKVGMTDSYNMDLLGVTQSALGEASVDLAIPVVNALSLPIPPLDSAYTVENGRYRGELNVNFSIASCPCSFEFEADGVAEVDGNSMIGDFQDPLAIDVPAGWTYTLASGATLETATPESGTTFELTGLGLVLTGSFRRCWKRKARA